MKERRGRRAVIAARSFNLHLSAPRPPARPLQRGPSTERGPAPPFAVDRHTCSGACAGPTEEEHLGIREKGDGGRKDGREGGGGRICHARREEPGRGCSPGQTPKRTDARRRDGPGRGRSVVGGPWALCPTKRPSRVRSRWLSKRTLFQLTDGSVAVKTTFVRDGRDATIMWREM